MARQPTGARLAQFGINKELLVKFNDFREAYLGASEVRIISEALEMFMNHELSNNSGINARYEEIRRKRNGS